MNMIVACMCAARTIFERMGNEGMDIVLIVGDGRYWDGKYHGYYL